MFKDTNFEWWNTLINLRMHQRFTKTKEEYSDREKIPFPKNRDKLVQMLHFFSQASALKPTAQFFLIK